MGGTGNGRKREKEMCEVMFPGEKEGGEGDSGQPDSESFFCTEGEMDDVRHCVISFSINETSVGAEE